MCLRMSVKGHEGEGAAKYSNAAIPMATKVNRRMLRREKGQRLFPLFLLRVLCRRG